MGQERMNKDKEAYNRRYWLWVTRPDYYLEKSGADRECLDPKVDFDTGGWWTCHADTQKGDLVLLYRSKVKRDLGYLIQAESDAYSIADDQHASEQDWDYGCDYQPLYKFEKPVTLQDMRENPYLHDWGAYVGNFQRRVYEIPLAHWQRLNEALSEKNTGYERFLENVQESTVVESIMREEELEEVLIHDLRRLKPFGYDLELCVSPIDGASGRQLVCKGNGGRIDLFCYDRKKEQYVVIELKNVRSTQNTFGQICNYVGWVQEKVAEGVPVKGLVISRGSDVRFQSAMKANNNIFQLDIQQLGFE
jgi:predicted RNA-binding protein with PUA-like domain